MRTLVLVALLAVPVGSSVEAGPPTRASAIKPKLVPEGCELIDRGLYVPTTPPIRFPDPTSVTGERYEIDEVAFLKQTRTVEMELGRGFGIRYRLRNLPKTKPVAVTARIFYPRPGIRGNDHWEHTQRESTANGELVQHLLYNFSNNWEMVPGNWRFQVLVDNQPACSFTFLVK